MNGLGCGKKNVGKQEEILSKKRQNVLSTRRPSTRKIPGSIQMEYQYLRFSCMKKKWDEILYNRSKQHFISFVAEKNNFYAIFIKISNILTRNTFNCHVYLVDNFKKVRVVKLEVSMVLCTHKLNFPAYILKIYEPFIFYLTYISKLSHAIHRNKIKILIYYLLTTVSNYASFEISLIKYSLFEKNPFQDYCWPSSNFFSRWISSHFQRILNLY